LIRINVVVGTYYDEGKAIETLLLGYSVGLH